MTAADYGTRILAYCSECTWEPTNRRAVSKRAEARSHAKDAGHVTHVDRRQTTTYHPKGDA